MAPPLITTDHMEEPVGTRPTIRPRVRIPGVLMHMDRRAAAPVIARHTIRTPTLTPHALQLTRRMDRRADFMPSRVTSRRGADMSPERAELSVGLRTVKEARLLAGTRITVRASSPKTRTATFMSVTMVKCTRRTRTEIGSTTKTAIGTVLKANRKQTQRPRANRKTQHVKRTQRSRTAVPRNKIGLRKHPILLRVALLTIV